MLSFRAFCLNDPSDRFIAFAILDTGVLALECCFSSLMSAAVYGLRADFFFALANLLSSIQEDLHSRQDFIINPKDAVAVEPLRVIKLQYRHAKMNPPLFLDP